MRTLGCVITLLLGVFLFQIAEAQEIQIKKSYFRGWKYSLDGGRSYMQVSSSIYDFRVMMEDNELALEHFNKYRSRLKLARYSGLTGVIIGGAVIAGLFYEGEWHNRYITLLSVSVPLIAASLLLQSSSSNNFRHSVELYNNSLPLHSIGLDLNQGIPPPFGGFTVAMKFQF